MLGGLMQVSPIAAVSPSEGRQVAIPQAKPVQLRSWAQRVAANGKTYFQDSISRQITWNDPVRAFCVAHDTVLDVTYCALLLVPCVYKRLLKVVVAARVAQSPAGRR